MRSKHRFVYRPVVAMSDGTGRSGNYQVTPDEWVLREHQLCVCERCGTAVQTNAPTQARAVANAKGIDCDTVIAKGEHES